MKSKQVFAPEAPDLQLPGRLTPMATPELGYSFSPEPSRLETLQLCNLLGFEEAAVTDMWRGEWSDGGKMG